ncbi:FixH family protein [Bacillaceae bacterium CLA-AA-H227]|uniref:FixH family protein n=1 Tax=Robertmurraya yapensis (ex Hitch et al 2024) TaxID=3133160 RepID=A0ACC6SI95_9BACI
MKKLLSILFITLVGIVFITGCTQKDEKSEEPLFTEVKLSVNPEKGEVNEPVIIEAKVTYGEEEVTDADEVLFEIWRAHDEEHEKMEIKHAENGIYRLEKSFEQEGTYYVISHVTAREMHSMPKTEFVIGEASEPEEDSSSQMNMEEHEEGEH